MKWAGRLFYKYMILFVGLVLGVLLINALIELYFINRENSQALREVQHEKAQAAAQRLEQYFQEIERQIGWTTYPQWASASIEQRQFDYGRLLRQVPTITELAHIDPGGREQLRMSRLAMSVVGANIDRSGEPFFGAIMIKKVYYGPVEFRKQSEPYMTMAVAGIGRAPTITVASLNLKLILDVITEIKVGASGYAYVVDANGRLIAHPDISLVLRNMDFSDLPHVAAAIRHAPADAAGTNDFVANRSGAKVLSANATIPDLDWTVFVELPREEAIKPVLEAATRAAILLVLGLALAALAASFLSRRLVTPIRAMQDGATRLGAGDLAHRLDIRTGDELEALASEFNAMAGKLRESHATLERKVEERTQELSEALEFQTATSEVLKQMGRFTADLGPVLDKVVSTATELCQAERAFVFMLKDGKFHLAAANHANPEFVAFLRNNPFPIDRGTTSGRVYLERGTVHIHDVSSDENYTMGQSTDIGQMRTSLGVPLLRESEIIGTLVVTRSVIKPFAQNQIDLITTFADQAAIAIGNTRLFEEVEARSRDLAEALEYQTATSDVLKEMGRLNFDLEPVLRTVVITASRLCEAERAFILLLRDNKFHLVVANEAEGEFVEYLRNNPIAIDRGTITGRVALEGKAVQIADLGADPEYTLVESTQIGHQKTSFGVPLLREGAVIGVIVLTRSYVKPFAPRQIDLVTTFADQAVIAIENVRLFRELEEKNRQLAIASQHKSQFLANMSHELRTPLNAILGYTEMMADGLYGELGEKAASVLDRVQRNGKHLLGLINDVLDLSKIEAGELSLRIDDYRLADIVAAVMSATESLAKTKGLELHASISPRLPTGRGDPRRLTQVLLNLVGNALKFTDKGGVEIQASSENSNFHLAVSDSGPGIGPEDQARIFEEFQQIDTSSTRKKGGTGLGLSISRKFIEMHGGTITVESQLGAGSTFHVTWPIVCSFDGSKT